MSRVVRSGSAAGRKPAAAADAASVICRPRATRSVLLFRRFALPRRSALWRRRRRGCRTCCRGRWRRWRMRHLRRRRCRMRCWRRRRTHHLRRWRHTHGLWRRHHARRFPHHRRRLRHALAAVDRHAALRAAAVAVRHGGAHARLAAAARPASGHAPQAAAVRAPPVTVPDAPAHARPAAVPLAARAAHERYRVRHARGLVQARLSLAAAHAPCRVRPQWVRSVRAARGSLMRPGPSGRCCWSTRDTWCGVGGRAGCAAFRSMGATERSRYRRRRGLCHAACGRGTGRPGLVGVAFTRAEGWRQLRRADADRRLLHRLLHHRAGHLPRRWGDRIGIGEHPRRHDVGGIAVGEALFANLWRRIGAAAACRGVGDRVDHAAADMAMLMLRM